MAVFPIQDVLFDGAAIKASAPGNFSIGAELAIQPVAVLLQKAPCVKIQPFLFLFGLRWCLPGSLPMDTPIGAV